MLPLIKRFFEALESEGVIYCHWKSNAYIAQAALGEDDLDLLISHSSSKLFLAILHRFDFKEALGPKGIPQIPGIFNYYGYDQKARKIVHVHAHYKLVLGHDMTKNYHLPIEDVYLESSYQGQFFRIPNSEFEFIVFIIRMMLKYSTWNVILSGEGRVSSREQQEMEHLRKKVSREKIGLVLAKHLPFLKLELFDECIRSLQPNCSIWIRLRAGYHVKKTLNGCRIRPNFQDIWLQFWRRLKIGAKRRLFRKVPRKRMKNGGILVAVIGGDGAGKTTVIGGILEWISPLFATMKIHLGKPSWSWMTILIRGILKIGRVFRFWEFTRVPLDFDYEKNLDFFPGYPTLIRAVCTARDRYLSYVKARRNADKGIFVICDRFPLPQMIPMDGPRIEWMTRTLKNNRFIRLLSKLENNYYQSILPPDLIFVLKVNPDTAVDRKSDENEASVRIRSKLIWKKDWKGLADYIVDANQPKTRVLDAIKLLLWPNI
jgi:thymidylate kinase